MKTTLTIELIIDDPSLISDGVLKLAAVDLVQTLNDNVVSDFNVFITKQLI